jgi:formylmethanofuran dehydrogenase subunit D
MAQSRFFPVIITSLILALLVGGGAAVAAKMITGKQIKNGTVTTKDVKNNNLTSKDLKNGTVSSKDLKNGTVSSKDIKNKTVATGDLANGSVTASKIAPGAIAFPNSLWSTQFRNQTGSAESNVQVGPGGTGQLNDGSLRLFTSTPTDVAAFGNSFEFAGVRLDAITDVQYSTYNAADPVLVRPA